MISIFWWNSFRCSACGLRQIKFHSLGSMFFARSLSLSLLLALHFHYFNFILREPYWKSTPIASTLLCGTTIRQLLCYALKKEANEEKKKNRKRHKEKSAKESIRIESNRMYRSMCRAPRFNKTNNKRRSEWVHKGKGERKKKKTKLWNRRQEVK